MVLLARPEGLTFERWAAEVVLQLRDYGVASCRPVEEKWQEWAVSASFLPALQGFNAPNPYAFKDWRAWAQRLILGVE